MIVWDGLELWIANSNIYDFDLCFGSFVFSEV